MHLWKRLALSAFSAGVAFLVTEGVVSLVAGRSIFGARRAPIASLGMNQAERLATASTTAGPYALDEDPWVSMRMKGNFAVTMVGKAANTDAFGQRVRTGPPPQPGAQRIVLLGDSVAFGVGLEDRETIGQRLEDYLRSVAGAGAPPPIVSTVACPGWSFDNERRYLLDHWERLAPDVVILLPVLNDLDDSFTVYESGYRAVTLDPARGARHPHTSVNESFLLEATRATKFPSARPASDAYYALYTGVTPESVRRYGLMASGCGEIARRLGARGGRFMVALYSDQLFTERLTHFLRSGEDQYQVQWLMHTLEAADGLVGDPHPNARCAAALAWRLARSLLANGWVRGAAGALPPEDDRYVGNERKSATAAETASEKVRVDALARAILEPSIDMERGVGWQQIYGGVEPDGVVGIGFWGVIPAKAPRKLELAVERLAGELYPLSLELEVNGAPSGTRAVTAAAGGRSVLSFDLPPEAAAAEFIEATVFSSDWRVETTDGRARLASYRLLSMTLR